MVCLRRSPPARGRPPRACAPSGLGLHHRPTTPPSPAITVLPSRRTARIVVPCQSGKFVGRVIGRTSGRLRGGVQAPEPRGLDRGGTQRQPSPRADRLDATSAPGVEGTGKALKIAGGVLAGIVLVLIIAFVAMRHGDIPHTKLEAKTAKRRHPLRRPARRPARGLSRRGQSQRTGDPDGARLSVSQDKLEALGEAAQRRLPHHQPRPARPRPDPGAEGLSRQAVGLREGGGRLRSGRAPRPLRAGGPFHGRRSGPRKRYALAHPEKADRPASWSIPPAGPDPRRTRRRG